MSTLMDGRIAERRTRVREVGARRRLRWLLGLLAVAALVGGAVWLVRSPVLAVRSVTVTGVARSQAPAILAASGIASGVPTISVDEAGAVQALEADPWIAQAVVTVTWPGTVEVAILEHRPVAWVVDAEGWMLASATGAVVARAAAPDDALPKVETGSAGAGIGSLLGDPMTLGALEFVAALPPELVGGAVVRMVEGELYASVAGYSVRLGSPVDMAQKAVTLGVLLDEGVPAGSLLNLVSARRPALVSPGANSQVQVESKGDAMEEPVPSG